MNIKEAFDKIGIQAEGFSKIKLGQGVIGKTSYVALAFVLVFGAVAFTINIAWMKFVLLLMLTAVILYYLERTKRFAVENPALALLEGAELLQYQKMEYEAKGMPNPPQDSVITASPLSSLEEIS